MTFFDSIRKRAFLLVFLSSLFYVSLIFYSDFTNFVNIFQNVNLYYLPVIISFVLLGIFLKSERQRFLLKMNLFNISKKDSFIIFNAGQSLLVTPAGIGSVVKSHFFKKKYGFESYKTITIILFERFFDIAGIISIVFIFLFFQYYEEFLLPTIVIGILVIVGILFIKNDKMFVRLVNFSEKIPIMKKITKDLSNSQDTVKILTSNKSLVINLPFSVLCWLIDAVAVYFCFLTFGLSFNFFETTLIALVSLILGALSFIPAGLGVTEISMISILVKNSVPLTIASALVLYMRLNTIWFSTMLGFITTKLALNKSK